MEHTPLPWKIRKSKHYGRSIIGADGKTIARFFSDEEGNPEFIVKTCNAYLSHDKLVKACEEMVRYFARGIILEHSRNRQIQNYDRELNILKQALAEAEGKE